MQEKSTFLYLVPKKGKEKLHSVDSHSTDNTHRIPFFIRKLSIILIRRKLSKPSQYYVGSPKSIVMKDIEN